MCLYYGALLAAAALWLFFGLSLSLSLPCFERRKTLSQVGVRGEGSVRYLGVYGSTSEFLIFGHVLWEFGHKRFRWPLTK